MGAWQYPPPNEAERWREIPGVPGYKVSSLGRVRSMRAPGRPHLRMRLQRSRTGYLSVRLAGQKSYLVGPLVLLTFVGPKPTPRHQGAHGDGRRDRNHLSNLRWATPKENHADRFLHGTTRPGEQATHARLTWAAVREILSCPLTTDRTKELAAKYWVASDTIRKVYRRETWTRPPAE